MKSSAIRIAVALSSLLAVAALLAFLMMLRSFGNQWVCELRGGKWASVPSDCITKDCFRTSTCGHWVAPWAWLNKIKPGDSLADVAFWLGEPDKIDGESHYWAGGKGEIGHFKLVIRDGRLISVGTPEDGDIPN